MKRFIALLMIACFAGLASADLVASFEDLAMPAGQDSWVGNDGSGGFTEGLISFPNNNAYGMWNGFAYSQSTDTTTFSYTNDESAITGSGYNSDTYLVGYVPQDWMSGTYDNIPISATFAVDSTVSGAYFTNTTYTALTVQNGSAPAARAFVDGDWLKLVITGFDAQGVETDTVEFYLADFRDGKTEIVTDWTWVDLSSLGEIKSLQFDVISTDAGDYGMNTPTYFAMDDMTYVPEPATLLVLGLGSLVAMRRRA